MVRRFVVLIIQALLALSLAACAIISADKDQLFMTALAYPDDHITLIAKEHTAIFDIDSPRGIGRAAVRQMAGSIPDRILLRFHLAGLEELRFAYDTTVVTVSVASIGDPLVFQEVTIDAGEPQAITLDSPYWMKTKLVSAQSPSANAIPLSDGYLEIEVPPDFLRTQSTAFLIEWVDFYR